ncbi:zinc transporter ZupT [Candidatus Woesearchaeota archaeon]|jgi:zinc transporter, ZIP family|nr:zinc transporter ZupT [Candidatus Woesearchaeota archaeon]
METANIWLPLLLTVIAGISTGVGSLIALCIKNLKKQYLYFSLGLSAGVMTYVSFAELLPSAVLEIGFVYANLAFFSGIIFIMILDFFIPHDFIAEKVCGDQKSKKLMTAGVLTAIGIAIHNLPEGMAVFVSSMNDLTIGISLAIAIAIHNIPEGMAVTIPIYYATKSKTKAFWYATLSGLVEPIGAIIAILFLMPYLTTTVMAVTLAFVAGIMVFISFDELLPLTFKEDDSHTSVVGIIVGMAIMALSIALI